MALWMNGTSGRDILSGIFRYAKTRIGWDIRLIQLPNATHPERIRRLIDEGVDGLIASDFSNTVLKDVISRTSAPVVFIGPPSLSIPRPPAGKTSCVSCDDSAIGELGARHFLSLGSFNSFGFLNAEPDDRIDRTRLADWLQSLPKPAAVMAFYDPLAVQVLDACRELGIAVPGQVSILGVDNDGLLCEFCDPPLSSIQPDHERAGYLAARELHALMSSSRRTSRTLVSPVIGIVERESTRPLTPAAHIVRKALEFIKANAAKGIGVKDVVAHLKISRRLADLRFREIEGRSILQAIETRRLELAERALAETERPVKAVARESGYRNVKTFEAAFRRKHGITPSAFRNGQSAHSVFPR